MYILKVDKNEFTENGERKEYWGYALYNNTNCIKTEVIKARCYDTDTRVMRYIRCYTWALERILGYFNVNSVQADEISIYFTNRNIVKWIQSGGVNKIYLLAINKLLGYIDDIPVDTVNICGVNRNWMFRNMLNENSVKSSRGDNYMKLTDLINLVEV